MGRARSRGGKMGGQAQVGALGALGSVLGQTAWGWAVGTGDRDHWRSVE